jgi:hypothetical protein
MVCYFFYIFTWTSAPFRLHKKFPKNLTLVWRDVWVTLLETGELQMDYIPSRVFAELREQFNQARLAPSREDNCERNDEYMIEWIQTCRLWSWWVDRQIGHHQSSHNNSLLDKWVVEWRRVWINMDSRGHTLSLSLFLCVWKEWLKYKLSLVGNWAILDIDWLISKLVLL